MSGNGQSTLVIRGGMLIDGAGNPPVENRALVVEGNRIRSIGPSAAGRGHGRPGDRGRRRRGILDHARADPLAPSPGRLAFREIEGRKTRAA